MSSPEEFKQLALKFVDALQYDYEVIRPIVLFAERIAERSRQTGIERTVVGEKARRFVEAGTPLAWRCLISALRRLVARNTTILTL